MRDQTVYCKEYKSIKDRLDSQLEAKKTTGAANMTAAQKIGYEFPERSSRYTDMKLLNLCCSKTVLEEFGTFCSSHHYFEKSFLLSYLLENDLNEAKGDE